MNDTTAAVILAAMLFALAFLALIGALVLSRRLARARNGLRTIEARLGPDAAAMAARWGRRRASLVEVSAAGERALWSLARLDERLDTARVGLTERRTELDMHREQIIAAGRAFVHLKRGARMLTLLIELRRTILA